MFAPLLLIGCGIGLATAPAQTAAMEAAPKHRSGSAAGLVSMSRYLGAIIGLAALTRLIADGSANQAPTALNGAAFLAATAAAAFLPARTRGRRLRKSTTAS